MFRSLICGVLSQQPRCERHTPQGRWHEVGAPGIASPHAAGPVADTWGRLCHLMGQKPCLPREVPTPIAQMEEMGEPGFLVPEEPPFPCCSQPEPEGGCCATTPGSLAAGAPADQHSQRTRMEQPCALLSWRDQLLITPPFLEPELPLFL